MFKNKQKHLIISMVLMVLFLITLGTAFSADLNETLEVQEVSLDEDNLENSQNSEINEVSESHGKKFSEIQKEIFNATSGQTIKLDGYYSADNNESVIYIDRSVNIVGSPNTVLDGNNVSRIFSFQKTGLNSVVDNIKFINGMDERGGAVVILAKNVTIQNSVFENNHATYGGAIYVLSEFDKNSSKYPEAGENLIIKNCNFTNNFAVITAGAVAAFGNNTQIMGCNFISNKAIQYVNSGSYGGAIQISRDGYNLTSIVKDCNFINNEAFSYDLNNAHGGAGCIRGGVTYQNCKFINNSAGCGGALTFHSSGAIKDCIFIDNSAKLFGGAVSTCYSDFIMNVSLINCDFSGNFAPTGGAAQLKGDNIEIKDSTFTNNNASLNGGAINIVSKTVNLYDNYFNRNIAYVNGGAIYINGDKTTVFNSSFIANEAIPDVKKLDDGLGGAIYINGSTAIIWNNTFNNNVARNGSVIYYDKYGLNCVILNNSMSENQAWVYALPISAEDIYYGETCKVSATIFGGNNIAKYGDLLVSNAIYNAAGQDKINVDGETPNLGAVDTGKLYQDSREYAIDILLVITHEDGSIVFNRTLKSDFKGLISSSLENLKPGKYMVNATHFEDTYYKHITNITYFTVYPVADLQVDKSSDLLNLNYGDVVMWTLNITNNGPNRGTGIVLKDLIPEGLVVLSCGDENYDKKTGILNMGSLEVGESKIINITTLVNKTGTFINHASVSGNETDWNLNNNNDSAGIHVNKSADLAIVKLVNDTNPNFNSLVKWTLKVTNNGPDTATGVVVCDLLSKALVYVSSNGDYSADTGLWNIGILEAGKSVSIDIVTLVNQTGKIINRAVVSGEEYDWNSSNNNDTIEINVNKSADLAIVKLVNDTNPNFNSLVKWTLIATNNGPDTATGVIVYDMLPEGLISMDKSFNGTWNIGQLFAGQTKELSIVCLVNKTGEFINIANITGDEYDWNITNNVANKTIDVKPSADVYVKKYVDNATPDFGDIIKWSIVVSNNGPDTATNVKVKDVLDNGLIFVKSSLTNGNYDVKSGIWTISSLAPEVNETLDIYCKVNKLGRILNVVSVNSSEYDWNSSNNDDDEFIDPVPIADLSVIKLINNSNPNYNDLVKWSIIVKNNGPNLATGVVVNDLLPNGLEYISSTGSYNPITGTWYIGNLDAGAHLQLDIVSKIVKTGDIINVVTVKGNEKDNNVTNNNYEKSIYVKPAADLSIKKSVSKQEVKTGDLINYLIEVTNNGPDVAQNVKVSELLNSNLKLLSFKATKGIFDNESKVLTVDSLASGEKVLLTLGAVATAAGYFENKVVVSSDTFDYDESNNYDEVYVNVVEKQKTPANYSPLAKKSLNADLESLTDIPSLASVELPKTGLPIALLLLVAIFSIGFLPIKISKKR